MYGGFRSRTPSTGKRCRQRGDSMITHHLHLRRHVQTIQLCLCIMCIIFVGKKFDHHQANQQNNGSNMLHAMLGQNDGNLPNFCLDTTSAKSTGWVLFIFSEWRSCMLKLLLLRSKFVMQICSSVHNKLLRYMQFDLRCVMEVQ